DDTVLYYENDETSINVLKIDSVEKYINIINEIIDTRYSFSREIFYRGHGNIDYIPVPSIFRYKKDYTNEKLSLTNTLREYSDLKLNTNSSINKLKFVQHYKTNTRLMDLTEDPLTALYFAVENDNSKDAEVLLYAVKQINIKFDNSDKVAILSSLSKLRNNRKLQLEDYIKNTLANSDKFVIQNSLLNDSLTFVKNSSSYIKEMKMYNDEIYL